MSAKNATTPTPRNNTPTRSELQDEVRKLKLELAAYRVFGTPLEIEIRLATFSNRISVIAEWLNDLADKNIEMLSEIASTKVSP